MTPTRPNTLSISVKVYKKNIVTNKYQHDAYYCTYDTNSSQPMRQFTTYERMVQTWFCLLHSYKYKHGENNMGRIGVGFPIR